MRLIAAALAALLGGGLIWLLVPWPPSPPVVAAVGDPKRGEYILRLGGCVACHTDAKNGGQFLAGGRPLKTPFGSFYPPNITPDLETGIGGWSTGAFVQAMTIGRSPGGRPLYPAFPYISYTRMTEQDLVDLKAYLDTVKPVANAVPAHDLRFPFGFRPLLKGWQLLFFDPGTWQPDPTQARRAGTAAPTSSTGRATAANVTRRATPWAPPSTTASSPAPATGRTAKRCPTSPPTRTPASASWSKTDITFALQTGILPSGDVLGGAMSEVIDDATSHFTPDDRAAIAEYLLSLPPLKGPPRSSNPSSSAQ